MTAISKLLILIGLNFCALALLIYRLIKDGNKYPEALRIAWEWIITQNGANIWGNPSLPTHWAMLLGKTWWMMLLIFLIAWVISRELAFWPVFLFLILLHIYWFLEGHVFKAERFERTLNLNHNWGIIYKEIEAGSWIKSKTLAELDLRKKNLLVLAIERQGQLTPFPKGLEILSAGDRMVMFGDLYSFHSIFENGAEAKPTISENCIINETTNGRE